MINIALAGTWHVHFDGYARDIQRDGRCNIVALWDPDKTKGKESAEKYNCEFCDNYDEMLKRTDIDAVMVCSSTDSHKEVISKAAKAGKHIFTEKVLCFNEKDAVEVAEEVKKSGVKFCISFPWRTRGDFLWMKQAIEEKLVGEVNYIRVRNAHNGTIAGWLPDTFYDKEKCGGGAMMDLGAHPMYLLNWFMGLPVKASSAFTNCIVKSVEDNAVTIFTYANGAIGVSETSFMAPNNPYEVEIVGSKGTILSGGFLDRTAYNIGDGWVFPKLPAGKPSPMQAWIDAMENGTEIPYTIDDAVELSKVMEMAYKSVI